MAPARTGRAKRSKNTVMATDQTNKGIRFSVKAGERILIQVVMKLIAPKIEEAPAR